ncbi:transporter substrate-binding domain-containing protein [Halopseudomonas sabulinigri]|uniref:Solute-binding protein family 3/N-terminal domain-containing protein n=1 Tax=Halopseudomonas sabulinigri TaxID=472181 RepID=A0ABP9ZMP9_9GAMM
MPGRLWLALLLTLPLAAQSAPLRLNTDIFPPYQVQEGDRLTGSSIKALACIFSAMDRDYEIRVLPWQRAVHDVSLGRAEGFFSATRMNRASDFATLSAPLALEKWYWFSNNPVRPPAFGTNSTLRIGGVRGSNQVDWLLQHGYEVDPLVTNTSQLLHLLKRGRIDAFLADQQTLRIELTQQPLDLRPRNAYFQQYTTLGVYFANALLGREPNFLEQFNQQVYQCIPEISVLQAEEREQLQKLHRTLFANWRHEPALIEAILQQNQEHANISLSGIHELDQRWQTEQRQVERPLISSVLGNSLSAWLAQQQASYKGLISEIMVTDQHGLNVAASEMTTDYWQGDEAKFADAFFASQDSPFMGPLSYDQSTQRYQVHISTAIHRPGGGEVIGVMVIGIDIERALKMENSLFDGESTPQ